MNTSDAYGTKDINELMARAREFSNEISIAIPSNFISELGRDMASQIIYEEIIRLGEFRMSYNKKTNTTLGPINSLVKIVGTVWPSVHECDIADLARKYLSDFVDFYYSR